MDIRIYPGTLHGEITAIPSKSQAHRLLICSAFADKPTKLFCPQTNQDIEATVGCLNELGAVIKRTDYGYFISPIRDIPRQAVLNCAESGSTLRFLLPIVGALGIHADFLLGGRLPTRPLSPLWEEMMRMGCILSRPTGSTVRCTGKLQAGTYSIRGDVSSQYISGLLFALPLLPYPSQIEIVGKVESAPYIEMTIRALNMFGLDVSSFRNKPFSPLQTPEIINVEGDWSNAAFFLAANTMGSNILLNGLDHSSPQGDRRVSEILTKIDSQPTIEASDIPDLVPILAVCAAAHNGARFTNIQRLRLKESDRVASVCAMLKAFGCNATASEFELTVFPGIFHGCEINSANDHRIAMAAAIGATVAQEPVTIQNAQCVQKSYPDFWNDYKKLGGSYEQLIR